MKRLLFLFCLIPFVETAIAQKVSHAYFVERTTYSQKKFMEELNQRMTGKRGQFHSEVILPKIESVLFPIYEKHAKSDQDLLDTILNLYHTQHKVNLDTAKKINIIKIGYYAERFLIWNDTDTIYTKVNIADTKPYAEHPDFSKVRLLNLDKSTDKMHAFLFKLMKLASEPDENKRALALTEAAQEKDEKSALIAPILEICLLRKQERNTYDTKSYFFSSPLKEVTRR